MQIWDLGYIVTKMFTDFTILLFDSWYLGITLKKDTIWVQQDYTKDIFVSICYLKN